MPRSTARLGILALSALLCGTAVAAAPDQPQATLTQDFNAGIRDAQTKRAAHDYAGAIKVLSQLMLVSPDDPRVVGEYGKVLVQQGRTREAIDFLVRDTQLSPGDWTVYSALGIAYDQTANYASARNAYETALAIKPGETVVLNNYAMSRVLAGDLVQARKLIAQAAANSKDELIARNLKLIDGLPMPAVTSASAPAPAKIMPSAVAQHAPHPLTTPAATAVNAPKIMMQSVPHDPQAGQVATAKATKHAAKPKTAVAKAAPAAKPAAVTPVKVVKPASNGIPALRLANDRP